MEGGGTHSSSSAGSCSSQQDSRSITRSLLQQNNMNEIYLFVFDLTLVGTKSNDDSLAISKIRLI